MLGGEVSFPNGDKRVIQEVWAENSVIWLDGSPFKHPSESSIASINLTVLASEYHEYTASLFHRSFSVSDLQKIPVSWGKSEGSLKSKMKEPVELLSALSAYNDISSLNDFYKVQGVDPQLTFDLAELDISGSKSGLLRFDFECIGQQSEPVIQVFWWGDSRSGPFEASSVRFTAENGTLIVPLDASPWWANLNQVKGIRIDLERFDNCEFFQINDLRLYARN